MKTKFILGIALMLSSVLVAQSANFEETMEWIKGKMQYFKYSEYENLGGVNNRWRYTDYYTYKLVSASNCEVNIEETKRHVTSQNTARNDYTTTKVYSFNFSDIKEITYSQVSGNEGFHISVLNDAKKIKINPGSSYTTLTNELWIRVTDLGEISGQPERFISAFKNAMQLCGASEEKF